MHGLLTFLLTVVLAAGLPVAGGEQVRVPLWAETESGEPAVQLSAAALSATLGGDAVEVGRVLGPADDLLLLIVSDLAGDMTLVDTAKKALRDNLDQLPPNASVGLMRAQEGLRVLADPTPERALLSAAIESLPVSGRASLLEAVAEAAGIGDAILSKAAVRLAVLFVTDSAVANYREDLTNPVINHSDGRDMSRRFSDALVRERISKLETTLTALQTPVFILHLNYRSEGLDQAYQAGLMRLAAVTGGRSYFCRSQAEIPDSTRLAFEAISSQYSVEVLLPERSASWVDVTLESPGHSLSYRNRFTR